MFVKKAIAASIGLATALTFFLSGCAAATSGGTQAESSSAATVEREAGWLTKPIKVCVHNQTSRSQSYALPVVDATGENGYNSGTLGVGAFVCAVSVGDPQGDIVPFAFWVDRKAATKVVVISAAVEFRGELYENINVDDLQSGREVTSGRKVGAKTLTAGATQTIGGNSASVTFLTDGALKDMKDSKGYIFTVRLFDPS